MFSARVSAVAATLALLAASGCHLPGAEEILSGLEGAAGRAPDARQGPGAKAPGTGGTAARADREQASETLVDDYVSALAATSDPERMREGLDLTEDGSTAHGYLRHYSTLSQAWADGGDPMEDAQVRSVAGVHELCRTQDPDGQPVCVVHESFTEDDGRLTDLRVDGKDPATRLSGADDVTDDSEGVRATFLSAYRTEAEDTLVVTVDLATTDDVSLDLDGASYAAEGTGDEETAERSAGRYELDAESATHAAFYFPGSEPGGELRLGGCLAECSARVELVLPVPD